uniref:LAGLIDADG endonuclease n=1 Tax=Chrysoporthe austroafricana TaxID=354353 RepID=A0A191MWP2_9PEZI|nr:LAGLIDADG endonuclease [Chrysoporthe austroafricana]AMX22091.1 LAGLIDADG endonuclease [Chrysoporthe austroafricana]
MTTNYPSIRKAAIALNVSVKSLNCHIISRVKIGLISLYKGQYLITLEEVENSPSNSCIGGRGLNVQDLPLKKFFVYNTDMTLAYVFDSLVELGRTLTPHRCKIFSDSELSKNKNMQHILRVINKGILTKTELGKFYLFKNPGYSNSLALVVWGCNLYSTIGSAFSIKERDMVKFTPFSYSVIIGIVLSDGRLAYSARGINKYFRFKQSLDKSGYVWFVFSYLAHYCSSLPYLVKGKRAGKETMALEFYTRALPCISEIYSMFTINDKKIIPLNIYNILTPVALAHLIMGDGSARDYGLTLCTDCYTIHDVIRLMNVLIIRYGLTCTLQKKRDNQYRIYISSKSMALLRSIVAPYMHSSMLYKLGIKNDT